jgi:hypothetical protein
MTCLNGGRGDRLSLTKSDGHRAAPGTPCPALGPESPLRTSMTCVTQVGFQSEARLSFVLYLYQRVKKYRLSVRQHPTHFCPDERIVAVGR